MTLARTVLVGAAASMICGWLIAYSGELFGATWGISFMWIIPGGCVSGLLVAAILLGNLYLAYRFSRGESVLPVPPDVLKLARIGIIGATCLTVFIMSLVFGLVAQGRWETFLLFFNRISFGIDDPQFHRDMSFHVFVMPMLHFIQGWLMGVVIASLVAVVALSVIHIITRIRIHICRQIVSA